MRAETRHPVRQLVQTELCGSTRNDKPGVIGHAYRRAAYTSEPTNAEAPIWAAYRLPTEYLEIGVFRITDDSIYLLRTNATPKGVPGQRPHLGAFVAPSSSSLVVRCSVVLLGVCGSVVLS